MITRKIRQHRGLCLSILLSFQLLPTNSIQNIPAPAKITSSTYRAMYGVLSCCRMRPFFLPAPPPNKCLFEFHTHTSTPSSHHFQCKSALCAYNKASYRCTFGNMYVEVGVPQFRFAILSAFMLFRIDGSLLSQKFSPCFAGGKIITSVEYSPPPKLQAQRRHIRSHHVGVTQTNILDHESII